MDGHLETGKKKLKEYKIGDSHKYIIEGMRIWFCGKENYGFLAWKTPCSWRRQPYMNYEYPSTAGHGLFLTHFRVCVLLIVEDPTVTCEMINDVPVLEFVS